MTMSAGNPSTPVLRDLPDEAQRIVAALEASLASRAQQPSSPAA